MFCVDRCQYKLFQVDNRGRESFRGSGFVVDVGKLKKMVTAAHVAFEGNSQVQLIARQYEGNVVIERPDFRRKGYLDIAEIEISSDELDGLKLGNMSSIVNLEELRIRPIYLRDSGNPELSLRITRIGGIETICRKGNFLDKRYDKTFEFEGIDQAQVVWPGCSGSPVIDINNRVVGVVTEYSWECGRTRNWAYIFVSDYE